MDLQNIFLGDAPWTMLVEIVFRTFVMYVYTLLVVRLLGKRGLGQVSPFEFVIIISLGSAVGDPMFYADVPLLHGMTVVTVVVLLQRTLVHFTEHNAVLEAFIESRVRCLVDGGRIDTEALDREDLSREELFTALREGGVEHLGQVKRAYLEPSGKVTVFTLPPAEAPPGLAILPPCGDEEHQPPGPLAPAPTYVCRSCGETRAGGTDGTMPACPHCGATSWEPAVGGLAPPG